MPSIAKETLIEFIEAIPEDKLTGFPTNPSSDVYKDCTFCRFMKSLTTADANGLQHHMVQILVNKDTPVTTLKKAKGKPMSKIQVPADGSWSANDARTELTKNMVAL